MYWKPRPNPGRDCCMCGTEITPEHPRARGGCQHSLIVYDWCKVSEQLPTFLGICPGSRDRIPGVIVFDGAPACWGGAPALARRVLLVQDAGSTSGIFKQRSTDSERDMAHIRESPPESGPYLGPRIPRGARGGRQQSLVVYHWCKESEQLQLNYFI